MSQAWAQIEEERHLQNEKRRQKYLDQKARLQAVSDANKQKRDECKNENSDKECQMAEEPLQQKTEQEIILKKEKELQKWNEQKEDAEYARRRPVKEEKPAKKC